MSETLQLVSQQRVAGRGQVPPSPSLPEMSGRGALWALWSPAPSPEATRAQVLGLRGPRRSWGWLLAGLQGARGGHTLPVLECAQARLWGSGRPLGAGAAGAGVGGGAAGEYEPGAPGPGMGLGTGALEVGAGAVSPTCSLVPRGNSGALSEPLSPYARAPGKKGSRIARLVSSQAIVGSCAGSL